MNSKSSFKICFWIGVSLNILYLVFVSFSGGRNIVSWGWFFVSALISSWCLGVVGVSGSLAYRKKQNTKGWIYMLATWSVVVFTAVVNTLLITTFSKTLFDKDRLIEFVSVSFVVFLIIAVYNQLMNRNRNGVG